jgi:hypothetical protein
MVDKILAGVLSPYVKIFSLTDLFSYRYKGEFSDVLNKSLDLSDYMRYGLEDILYREIKEEGNFWKTLFKEALIESLSNEKINDDVSNTLLSKCFSSDDYIKWPYVAIGWMDY